ncbi:UNVERIFIED_CONTAM: hypothetical protein FKN15_071408 [Acipenser sinensis]
MGPDVPLLNEYKQEFFWKRFPQTVLGGPQFKLGYCAPPYIYVNQIILFLTPWVFGGVGTLLYQLLLLEDYYAAVLSGGLMVIAASVVQIMNLCARRRTVTVERLQTQNILTDEEEFEFASCAGSETIKFIIPGKKFIVNTIFHTVLAGALCGLGTWYLLLNRLSSLYNNTGAAVMIFVFGWVTLCIGEYSLIINTATETATFQAQDTYEITPLTRPLYIFAFIAVDLAHRFNATIPDLQQANQALHIIFLFLPLLWALGILSPVDALFLWGMEQTLVFGLGGSAMSTDIRLVVMFLVSVGVAIGTYFIPSSLGVVLFTTGMGFILSLDFSQVELMFRSCCRSPDARADLRDVPRSLGWRLGWKEFFIYLTVLLAALAEAGLLHHFGTISETSASSPQAIVSYILISLLVVSWILREIQGAYIFYGVFRNPFYPQQIRNLKVFKQKQSGLMKAGIVRRLLINLVSPFAMIGFLAMDISLQSLHTVTLCIGFTRAFRTVGIIWDRLIQFLSKLKFALTILISSWTEKKQRRKSTATLITINAVLFPMLLAVIALSAVLSAPLLPLFTLPVFLVGFPRPVRSWPGTVGAAACMCPDSVYYQQMMWSLTEAFQTAFATGSLGKDTAQVIYEQFLYLGRTRPVRSWPGTVGAAACMCPDSVYYQQMMWSLTEAFQTAFATGSLGKDTAQVGIFWDRLFQFLSKLKFALTILISSWTEKKQRRKSTATLITINAVLFPMLLAVIALSAVLSAPLLPLFTLPVFLVGFPRPVRSWPGTVGAAACMCPDSVYYQQMMWSLTEAFQTAFATGSLGVPSPGTHFLCRFQDRVMWVMVLERGFSYCSLNIKGLELQETSCHTAEARKVDELFEMAFEQEDGLEKSTVNHHFSNILTPCAALPVRLYSDARNVLTGIIDSHDNLKQMKDDFVKILFWVLLQHCSKKSQTLEGTLPEDMRGAKPAQVVAEQFVEVNVATIKNFIRKTPSLNSETFDDWSDDDDLFGPEPTSKKTVLNNAAPKQTSATLPGSVEMQSPFCESFSVKSTDKARQALGFGLPAIDKGRELERLSEAEAVPMVIFSSSHSKQLNVPQEWRSSVLPGPRMQQLRRLFPEGWYKSVLSQLDIANTEERPSDILEEVLNDGALMDLYAHVVMTCYGVTLGAESTVLSPSYVYKVYCGDVPWTVGLDWLTGKPELFQLVLKAFRYTFKLMFDKASLGLVEDFSELANYLEEYERDWYIGRASDARWQQAVLQKKPYLFSLGHDPTMHKKEKKMGAFLDKPKMEKHNAHGAGNSLHYGLSSMQGWRVEMEDAHTAVIGLPNGLDQWSFFAVYDGHAGSQVAKYCCEHLLEHITSNPDFKGADQEPAVENVKTGIRTGFLQIDEHMRAISEKKHGVDRSGSTAVGVMISPKHIYFINCGDSRGLLSRSGKVHFFTQDHKPSNPLEKERIQNAGGSVMIQRVNGSLAVSRALGDFDYKCVHGKGPTEQLVSPEPEVYEIERSELEDQFIILACDGIWDVMANEELCDFVRSRLEVTDDLEKVCNEIVDTCLYKGSRDNMSVVLICLPGAPKVSPEAVKREAELDKYLESRVEGGASKKANK